MLTVRLPDNIEARLNTLAKTTNRPNRFYVREALELSLEEIKDIYLAEARLENTGRQKQNRFTGKGYEAPWHGSLRSIKQRYENLTSRPAACPENSNLSCRTNCHR